MESERDGEPSGGWGRRGSALASRLRPATLDTALTEALAHPGPALVEVVTDPELV